MMSLVTSLLDDIISNVCHYCVHSDSVYMCYSCLLVSNCLKVNWYDSSGGSGNLGREFPFWMLRERSQKSIEILSEAKHVLVLSNPLNHHPWIWLLRTKCIMLVFVVYIDIKTIMIMHSIIKIVKVCSGFCRFSEWHDIFKDILWPQLERHV